MAGPKSASGADRCPDPLVRSVSHPWCPLGNVRRMAQSCPALFSRRSESAPTVDGRSSAGVLRRARLTSLPESSQVAPCSWHGRRPSDGRSDTPVKTTKLLELFLHRASPGECLGTQGTSPAITRIDRLGRSSHALRGKHFGTGPELGDHELSCLGGIAGNHRGDAENPVATELDCHSALQNRPRIGA